MTNREAKRGRHFYGGGGGVGEEVPPNYSCIIAYRVAMSETTDHRVSKRGPRVRTLQQPSLEFEKEVLLRIITHRNYKL